MGRIVVTEYVSVDGVIEAPSGNEEFARVGWTDAYNRGEAGDKFKFDETFASEAMLLGRRTYEAFAEVWPTFEGEFAERFNSMPKYVVSSTLEDPTWANSTVLAGDVVDEVEQLRSILAGDIVVHGSAQLVHTLIENDLVDELRLMVYPVIVGMGKRLVGDTSDTKRLLLADTRTFDDGVTLLVYRAAG